MAYNVSHLMKKIGNATLSTAESCTGGLLAGALTDLSGSSSFFVGGVVAYSNKLKVKLLDVNASLLATHGAVSGEVAEAMAEGARKVLGTTYGVSTTGVAGPSGGTNETPVGTVFIGIAGPSGVMSEKFFFPGTRENIRRAAVEKAIEIMINQT